MTYLSPVGYLTMLAESHNYNHKVNDWNANSYHCCMTQNDSLIVESTNW